MKYIFISFSYILCNPFFYIIHMSTFLILILFPMLSLNSFFIFLYTFISYFYHLSNITGLFLINLFSIIFSLLLFFIILLIIYYPKIFNYFLLLNNISFFIFLINFIINLFLFKYFILIIIFNFFKNKLG